jgi:hypothetical protein
MKRLTVLATALVLGGCGGGGGGGTTAPASTSVEGFWSGTTAGGTQVNLAILENGETWGLYGSSNTVTGALYGNTTTSGNSLSGSGSAFNFVSRTSGAGTYTGAFVQKATISFSASDGTAFSGTYDTSYDQAPSLANVAGTYTGWAVTGGTAAQSATVVMDVNGNISSSYVSGNLTCVTSGKATPQASGKNVYNLQVTFTGNYCALGNGTVVNGVASYSSTNRQLIAIGLNSAKSDGFIFVGVH